MKTRIIIFVLLTSLTQLIAQPGSFSPHGIGGGGALFFPSINPSNDNEFYVSCDMSEMFHSADNGLTYDQVPFTKLQVFNNSTYEFTIDPLIAYCNYNDGNNGYPVKTTDAGATWNQLNAYDLNNYGTVYKMVANYYNADQLIIGSYGDILITNDGGLSFNLIKHATNMGAGIIVGGVFWDGAYIYIGTNEGIFYSTNFGASFNLMATTGMTAGHVIWSFAGSRDGANSRMVCIAANSSDTYNGINPWEYYDYAKEIYVMDNASGTWISKSTGINFANDFVMYAGMSKNDIETIYLGGNDDALGAPLVYKTDNGGNSWSKKFNTNNNANIATAWEGYQGDKNWGWSENCFGISVAPFNSNKVMFSTFSNVQISSDGGDHWRQAYVDSADQHPAGNPTPTKHVYHSIGLENTTCWQIHWQNANKMMGCFSDIGGIRSTDAGQSWGFIYSGFSVNSLYRVVKTSNGTMYGACSNIHDMYQSTRLKDAQLDANDSNGKIVFSSDDGVTWLTLHSFNHPVYWLATDPNDTNKLYASVIHYGGTQGAQQGGIYVTSNLSNGASSTWTKLSNPPRTEGHPSNIIVLNDGKVLCTFSGRMTTSSVFTASSGVFLYNPATSSWSDVSDAGMHYWTKDIIIDPSDPTQNTWYTCVFSGWGGAPNGLGGLYKTTNRGTSWTKLTGTQFDRVTSITFNPLNINQAFLTTETQGLWFSQDINTTTPAWQLVNSYPFRQPERVFFNPYDQNEVWVTSFGNGMKMGNMLTTGIVTFSSKEDKLLLYPNPTNGLIHLSNFKINGKDNLKIYNAEGRLIFSDKPQNETNTIDCSNWNKGIYFINYRNENYKIVVM